MNRSHALRIGVVMVVLGLTYVTVIKPAAHQLFFGHVSDPVAPALRRHVMMALSYYTEVGEWPRNNLELRNFAIAQGQEDLTFTVKNLPMVIWYHRFPIEGAQEVGYICHEKKTLVAFKDGHYEYWKNQDFSQKFPDVPMTITTAP